MPLTDPDGWYEELMNAHHGLSEGQSMRLNCALVLLLADRVADFDELSRCLDNALAAALDVEREMS